jgi:hypothetical protein
MKILTRKILNIVYGEYYVPFVIKLSPEVVPKLDKLLQNYISGVLSLGASQEAERWFEYLKENAIVLKVDFLEEETHDQEPKKKKRTSPRT